MVCMLCYCFGVSSADFERNPATRDFVMAQTKANLCSCETSNPSGRCCLKDFPKQGSESGFGRDISEARHFQIVLCRRSIFNFNNICTNPHFFAFLRPPIHEIFSLL